MNYLASWDDDINHRSLGCDNTDRATHFKECPIRYMSCCCSLSCFFFHIRAHTHHRFTIYHSPACSRSPAFSVSLQPFPLCHSILHSDTYREHDVPYNLLNNWQIPHSHTTHAKHTHHHDTTSTNRVHHHLIYWNCKLSRFVSHPSIPLISLSIHLCLSTIVKRGDCFINQ